MATYSAEFEVACSVFEIVVNVPMMVVYLLFFAFHCRQAYLDLFTSERLSVSHRRRAPEITDLYRYVGYCTIISGFFGVVAAVAEALRPIVIAASPSLASCAITTMLPGVLVLPSKLFVYFVFSLRYQMVYNGSQYAAKEGRMKYVNALLLIVALILCIWVTWSGLAVSYEQNATSTDVTSGTWSLTYEYTSVFDVECYVVLSDMWLLLYVIFDLIVNVAYCVKFILPIWQVIRLVQGSSRNVMEKSKLEKKMLFVGFKVFILSAVLFVSTIILVILYSGAFMPATSLYPVDAFINFVCLALMTPYYPDSKYYQRLCACCIFCCDRKGYTKKAELNDEKSSGNGDIPIGAQSPRDDNEKREATEEQTVFSSVSDPNQSARATSVDTMSAVRIATNEEASPMPSNGHNTGDQTNVEVELAQNLNN